MKRRKVNRNILDVEEITTVPHTPVSHPFVVRPIAILREFLDGSLFWDTRDLETKLEEFADFYNRLRFHALLRGNTPMKSSV